MTLLISMFKNYFHINFRDLGRRIAVGDINQDGLRIW